MRVTPSLKYFIILVEDLKNLPKNVRKKSVLGTTIIHFICPFLYLALPLFRFTDCHHYKTTFQLFLIICLCVFTDAQLIQFKQHGEIMFVSSSQIRSVRRKEEFLSHTSLCGSDVPVCFSERIPWGAPSLCGHNGLLGTDIMIGSGNVRCTYFIYWTQHILRTYYFSMSKKRTDLCFPMSRAVSCF